MARACYEIVADDVNVLLIRDVGPWNRHPTVTNDAEAVVTELAPCLGGRRLEYIDSEGRRDQLLVERGAFAGFAPAPEPDAPAPPTVCCARCGDEMGADDTNCCCDDDGSHEDCGHEGGA